jgi:hypothetical protein
MGAVRIQAILRCGQQVTSIASRQLEFLRDLDGLVSVLRRTQATEDAPAQVYRDAARFLCILDRYRLCRTNFRGWPGIPPAFKVKNRLASKGL